jgi:hypothetical protein
VKGSEVLKGVRTEQVLQWAWLAESARGDVEAHVLGEDACGRAYRQYCDVWGFRGAAWPVICIGAAG